MLATGNRPSVGFSYRQPHSICKIRSNITCESTWQNYNKQFEQILSSTTDYLVIPTTIRGAVIASRYRDRHIVFAEPAITSLRSFDKLALRRYLSPEAQELSYWNSHRNRDNFTYPILAKPRLGSGGNGHVIIRNSSELESVARPWRLLYEPLLGDNRSEYSMSFSGSGASRRSLAIRRITVDQGRTITAEYSPAAWDTLVAKTLDTLHVSNLLTNASNLQFAVSDDKVSLFDINPRFSGSELMRCIWGFNFLSSAPKLRPKSDSSTLSAEQALRLTLAATSHID